MQCQYCGSQDTTPKNGISKKTGREWKGYQCNEPNCKNDKGYANMTFVPTARKAPVGNPMSSLEQKVDQILAILKTNFPKTVTQDLGEEVSF